jgi:hypothetical protein
MIGYLGVKEKSQFPCMPYTGTLLGLRSVMIGYLGLKEKSQFPCMPYTGTLLGLRSVMIGYLGLKEKSQFPCMPYTGTLLGLRSVMLVPPLPDPASTTIGKPQHVNYIKACSTLLQGLASRQSPGRGASLSQDEAHHIIWAEEAVVNQASQRRRRHIAENMDGYSLDAERQGLQVR